MNQLAFSVFLIALAPSVAYLAISHRPPGWARTLTKTLPLLLFAIVALIIGAPPLLVGGLLLSAAGDFALSRPGQRAFLIGLVSFALAHVFYSFLFAGISGLPIGASFSIAPVATIVMLSLALSVEFWLIPHVGGLRWPVRAYVVLIGAMMLTALTLPAEYTIVASGAALFVVSDLALSIQRFRMAPNATSHRALGWLVWVFYLCGQAMILLGITSV